jgi:hypothetical protein
MSGHSPMEWPFVRLRLCSTRVAILRVSGSGHSRAKADTPGALPSPPAFLKANSLQRFAPSFCDLVARIGKSDTMRCKPGTRAWECRITCNSSCSDSKAAGVNALCSNATRCHTGENNTDEETS